MPHPSLAINETDVLTWCGSSNLIRGRHYVAHGLVQDARLRDAVLAATVRGSRPRPYEVSIDLSVGPGAVRRDCPCEGNCRHVAAVLLAWIQSPHSFAIPQDPASSPPALARTPSPASTPTPPSLLALLRGHRMSELREMAVARGVRLKGVVKKDEAATYLAEELARPEGIKAAIAALQPHQLVLLEAVLLHGGPTTPTAEVLGIGDWLGFPQELWQSGLADARSRSLIFYHQFHYCVLPSEVAPFVPATIPLATPIEGPKPQRVLLPRRSSIDDLCSCWQFFRARTVPLRPRQPTTFEMSSPLLRGWENLPSEIERLQKLANWQWNTKLTLTILPPGLNLGEEDRERLRTALPAAQEDGGFTFHLACDLGLVGVQGGQFVASEGALRDSLRQSTGRRLRAVWQAWLNCEAWSEVFAMEGVRLTRGSASGSFSLANLLPELAAARRQVVAFLRRLPEGRWLSFPSLLAAIRRLRPRLLHGGQLSQHQFWWMELKGDTRRLDPSDAEDWERANGDFIAQILRGPLRWMGAAGVALSSDGTRVEAFRFTEIGAYLFGRTESFPGEVKGPSLEVKPDLSVQVYAERADDEAYQFLDAVAEAEHLDPTSFRYRITIGRLQSVFQEGVSAQDIRGRLERLGGRPLPAAASQTLDEWWRSHGRVRLYDSVAVVDCSEEWILKEILRSSSLGQKVLAQVSPTAVVVAQADVESLLQELVRRGYTPRLVEDGA